MQSFSLSSGDKIPAIGLGTWKADKSIVGAAVESAIRAGYTHLDCAAIYLNEKEIGEALRKCFSQNLIARENLWITSKLWNSFHAYNDVEPALKDTLFNLSLDYLDLYLIHWPIAFQKQVGLNMATSGKDFISLDKIPLYETWSAMEELVNKGLVRNIGVSNFSQTKIESILASCNIKPAVNQIESHPYLLQKDLTEFCHKHNMHITAFLLLVQEKNLKDQRQKISLLYWKIILFLKLLKNIKQHLVKF